MYEENKMCLATALVVLHEVHSILSKNGVSASVLALETVFSFVDEILFVIGTDLGGDAVEENPLQNNVFLESDMGS